MSKHTPGPWRYIPEGDLSMPVVARGHEGGCTVNASTAERREADARLIAAAPSKERQ